MSYRLQVLIPERLEARVRKASQQCRNSKGGWMRRSKADKQGGNE